MKKLITVLAVLAMTFSMFAQNVKSTGLKDSDVKSWIKNYAAIQKDVDKLGIDVNNVSATSAATRKTAEDILEGYGISGPGSLDKYAMICQCAAVLVTEKQLSPEMMAMFKMFGQDPLAEVKANTNDRDYAVVAANADGVLKVYYDTEATGSGTSVEADVFSTFNTAGNTLGMFTISEEQQEENRLNRFFKKFAQALDETNRDRGVVYKVQKDLKPAEFKKAKLEAKRLSIDDTHIVGFVDFASKKVEITVAWNDDNNYQQQKFFEYDIKTVEVYAASREMYGNAIEYVIGTKQNAVLHFYKFESFDGNEFKWIFDFNGCPKDTPMIRWSDEK